MTAMTARSLPYRLGVVLLAGAPIVALVISVAAYTGAKDRASGASYQLKELSGQTSACTSSGSTSSDACKQAASKATQAAQAPVAAPEPIIVTVPASPIVVTQTSAVPMPFPTVVQLPGATNTVITPAPPVTITQTAPPKTVTETKTETETPPPQTVTETQTETVTVTSTPEPPPPAPMAVLDGAS